MEFRFTTIELDILCTIVYNSGSSQKKTLFLNATVKHRKLVY